MMAFLLFCGVNIPLETLPAWMQAIGNVLPFTHGLQAVRLAADGAGLNEVGGLIAIEFGSAASTRSSPSSCSACWSAARQNATWTSPQAGPSRTAENQVPGWRAPRSRRRGRPRTAARCGAHRRQPVLAGDDGGQADQGAQDGQDHGGDAGPGSAISTKMAATTWRVPGGHDRAEDEDERPERRRHRSELICQLGDPGWRERRTSQHDQQPQQGQDRRR